MWCLLLVGEEERLIPPFIHWLPRTQQAYSEEAVFIAMNWRLVRSTVYSNASKARNHKKKSDTISVVDEEGVLLTGFDPNQYLIIEKRQPAGRYNKLNTVWFNTKKWKLGNEYFIVHSIIKWTKKFYKMWLFKKL